jgi:hypothetical protein
LLSSAAGAHVQLASPISSGQLQMLTASVERETSVSVDDGADEHATMPPNPIRKNEVTVIDRFIVFALSW